jgi:two-component system, NarL family, response regulator DevR
MSSTWKATTLPGPWMARFDRRPVRITMSGPSRMKLTGATNGNARSEYTIRPSGTVASSASASGSESISRPDASTDISPWSAFASKRRRVQGPFEPGTLGATVGSVPSSEADPTQADTTEAQITVFLLDDHEIVRRGVKELLEAEPDIVVIGEGSTAAEALARVPALRPQVAVLDVRLPDGDGVSVCRDLRSKLPDLACLMLTSFADDDALYDAILAGAAGYVLKQIKGSDLVNAVRTIAGGGSLLDAKTTARIMQRLRDDAADREKADPFAALTSQERKILDLIGEGLTNRQIGERMFLAEKTVKNYVSSLLAKLGLERRTQAAILATESKQDKHPAP